MGCRSLCLLSCPEPDDEIRLILANCDLGIAKAAFWQGKVRYACRFFDEALTYASETLYPAVHIRAEAAVYFRYMWGLSPTLTSDVLDEDQTGDLICMNDFAEYQNALEALENGREIDVAAYGERFLGSYFFKEHLIARTERPRNGF